MDIVGSLPFDHRTVNVLTVIVGTFAGLYMFESLLGRRGGLLRQLIVMIPAAIIYGASAVVLNDLSNGFYARVYQDLFSLPVASAGAEVLVLQFALYGFMLPIMMPNLYRKTDEYDDALIVPLLIGFVFLQLVSKTLTIAVLLQVANIGHRLPFGLHLSMLLVLMISLAYGAATIPASMRAALMFRLPLASHWPKKWWEYITQARSVSCCLLPSVVVIQFYLILLATLTLGWAVLAFIAVIAALQLLLRRLQQVADSLPLRWLTYIALALFVLAAGLQLYQAMFL